MNKVRSFVSFMKLRNNTKNVFDSGSNSSFIVPNMKDDNKYHEELARHQTEDQFIDNLDYIMSISDVELMVLEKHYSRKLLKLAEALKKYSKTNRQLITFLEYSKVVENLVDILAKTMECNKTTVVEHHGRKQNENFKAHEDHSLAYCVRVSQIFTSTIDIVYYATDSRLFRRKFHEYNGTNLLLTYIMNGEFVADSVLAADINITSNYHILDTLRHLICSIQNVSKTNILDSRFVTEVLYTFSENVKCLEDQLIIGYMILSKVIMESQMDHLSHLKYIVEKLVYFIKIAANSIEKTDYVRRVSLELEKDLQSSACLITYGNLKVDIVEVLDTIYELNVCGFVKSKETTIFEDLKKIILTGNDTEAEYSVKLLFKFTFDPYICKILALDEQLKSIIKKIILYQYPNKNLIRFCEGFLWCTENVNKRLFRSSLKSNRIGSTRNDSFYSRHRKSSEFKRRIKILISYETSNLEFCIKFKNELKNFGIKVWLYDEHIQDYSLDKTMLAIQNSDCILICKIIINLKR